MVDEIQDAPDVEPAKQQAPGGRSPSNLALNIALCALLLWFAFQTVQLLRERSHLSLVKHNQDSAVLESEKIRTQFQTILEKTSELANQGHGGARMVMDELQMRGFALAPQSKSADKIETKPAK